MKLSGINKLGADYPPGGSKGGVGATPVRAQSVNVGSAEAVEARAR